MEQEQMATTEKGKLGGRLPLLSPKELDRQGEKLYGYMVDTKVSWAKKSGFTAALEDGRLIGPFNPFLYSPKTSRALCDWIDADMENSSLSDRARQIIIFTVGVSQGAEYEVYAHTAVGKKAGLKDEEIAAIKTSSEPGGLSDDESAAYQFAHSLSTHKKVDSSTYQLAVNATGEQGVVDMVHLIGLYLTTSAFLNAFEIPAP